MNKEEETLLEKALAYCQLREEIDEISRMADALPECPQMEEYYEKMARGDVANLPPKIDRCCCTIESTALEGPYAVGWWELTDEQYRALCEPCQKRVAHWTERQRLRRKLGARMAGLRRAFRQLQPF